MFNEKSGYIGKSMSVRARQAYNQGEMPISKWRKTLFIEELENNFDRKIKNIKGGYKQYLEWSSWHHTGALYNQTDFYKVDYDKVEKAISEEKIVFYTEAEEEEIYKLEQEETERQRKEFEEARKGKELEEIRKVKELQRAEKIIRKSKKGREITMINITKDEPIFYNILKNKEYAGTSYYAEKAGILGIVELKLK